VGGYEAVSFSSIGLGADACVDADVGAGAGVDAGG